jgi:hypothetical protein
VSTQPPETTPEAPAVGLTATLTRGRVYFYGDKEFENGVAVPITAEEKKWLETHAVDLVSIEDEGEHQTRAKFKFSGGAAPTRQRNRDA